MAMREATPARVDENVLIPDLLRAVPHSRPVLDRYGLRGCGGPLGPHETLGFFAKAHDVPLGRLLSELRAAATIPAPQSGDADPGPGMADTIYRPFFKAGIIVVLTAGAAWGAYLLARIAWGGSFKEAGLHEVNAHGHAQIFGWVGLFVMGFAYQAFPRFKHGSLSHPRLAYVSLGLMLLGVVGRSLGEPLAGSFPALVGPVVAVTCLEVVAVLLFAGIVRATWQKSGKPLAVYDYYIASALGWFVVQAVYEAAYLAATLTATDPERLLDLVATYQGPLREIQIHGFALLMILGVSQRIFPHFYGFPAPGRRRSLTLLIVLDAAVTGEVVGLLLMRTGGHGWAALWYAAVLLLAGSTAALVGGWRLLSTPETSDRSLKFLRAAYGWLFVSMAMLVLVPVYQYAILPVAAPDSPATRTGFSHAYYGAVRHAITVGFVSLMIVGVAAKVVPTLNGVDVRRLTPLWGPFALINGGCTLRVVGQTATDFSAAAFPVIGVSGLLEVAGLALWGAHLWRIMARGAPSRQTESGATAVSLTGPITATNLVGAVLDRYPYLRPTFLAFGFHAVANPLLRKTVAPYVTLATACRLLGVDRDEFLSALNEARQVPPAGRTPLVVLSSRAATARATAGVDRDYATIRVGDSAQRELRIRTGSKE
jgi:hypothetical protein